MGVCWSGSKVPEETGILGAEVVPFQKNERKEDSHGRFQCFLAHDWGYDEEGRPNHERVSRVKSGLDKAGIRAWFDEEQLRGDINGQMADGIDKSQLIVVFITTRYLEKVSGKGPNGMNDNCKVSLNRCAE